MSYYQLDEESSLEIASQSNISSKTSNYSLSKIVFAGLISIILIVALTINYPQKTSNISYSYNNLASVYGEKVWKTTLNNEGNKLIKFKQSSTYILINIIHMLIIF